jgi:hypothetical protein
MLHNFLPPSIWRSIWTDQLSFGSNSEYHFRFIETIRGYFEIDVLDASSFVSENMNLAQMHLKENTREGYTLNVNSPEELISLELAKAEALKWAQRVELSRNKDLLLNTKNI